MTDFSLVWAIITSGVSWIRSTLWKEYSDRKNASIYQAGRRFIDRFTETDADALHAAKSTYYNQNQLSFFTDWILIFHFRRHTVAHFSFKFGGKLFMCSFLLKSKNLCKTIPDISLLELLWNQSLRSISLTHYLSPGGGGYSWEFLVWVCHPVLQILTLFQTKKCYFSHPFTDQTSKIHTRFQT